MGKTDIIKEMTKTLIANNDGAVMLTFKAVAKAYGCHTNAVPRLLDKHGVLVQRFGRKKMVAAMELARVMCTGLESPLENSRPDIPRPARRSSAV